jgi:cell division septal protein FtsQ
MNIKDRVNLLELDFKEVNMNLMGNPWVKKVYLRRQFPDTLMVRIDEAVPKALLYLKGRTFLIEKDGNILEEIEDKSTPFLPVIMHINPEKDIKSVREALKLVETISRKNILSNKESVQISIRSYGPEMNIDGEIVKVGYGRYSEKLDRWEEIEPEVRNVGPIRYIDLRFRDKVIIKPVKTVKRKT